MTDNEIIAEFMKVEKCTDPNCEGGRCYAYPQFKSGYTTYRKVAEMKYETSWDWLMPVVEKIISLGIDINIDADRVFIHANNLIHVRNEDHGSKIETVYTAVVECIKSFEPTT